METKDIRLLTADEIECRVGTCNGKGASLLLYKDARVDMRMLDEVFGRMNWKRSHEVVNGNLYCTVSVWDEDKGAWVSKEDVGTESKTEAEKGEASDAFKRACFNWGIGRELYTAPFVWVELAADEIDSRNGKPVPRVKFKVKDIAYNDRREISSLTITDQRGNVRFSYPKAATHGKAAKASAQQQTQPTAGNGMAGTAQDYLAANANALAYYNAKYGCKTIDDYTSDELRDIYSDLKKHGKL